MENIPPFTPEEAKACVKVLEALLENRAHLGQFSTEERRQLLIAAGRVSRPDRLEFMRLAKARRKAKRQKEKNGDRQLRSQTIIRTNRRSAVYIPPPKEKCAVEVRELVQPRNCYVCKVEYRKLHFFYDAMCSDCGDFNYAKRFQTAPLQGRYVLVTGARLKIGYQAALMVLRAGATLIATTRFPHDAVRRFLNEPDAAVWKARLHVHGLDLRHAPSVESFSTFVNSTYPRLDILINNAAQTVRRPPGFYAHLMEWENKTYEELPPDYQGILHRHEQCRLELSSDAASTNWLAEWSTRGGAIGLQIPATLSQVACLPEDYSRGDEFFPEGKRDADLQQVDLRKANSWRMRLAEVPTPELLEVQLVNSIAPFILCSKLKPLMLRDRTNEKHIVNVSAMEGKFSRNTKTDKHPHTNMAKAALNMMTLTSAPDYLQDGIFMNAVDTGWVTDEDPVQLSLRKQEEHDFQPPLDIVDGAARVCDPFFSGLLTGEHVWGKFLKDYFPTAW